MSPTTTNHNNDNSSTDNNNNSNNSISFNVDSKILMQERKKLEPRKLGSKPPVETVDPKVVDSMLAAELNELSMQDRDSILQNIHGIKNENEIVKETPELIASSLEKLQQELQTICTQKRSNLLLFNKQAQKAKDMTQTSAYQQAEMINTDFVRSDKFRLKFLRAESFNVHLAAIRIMAYFEVILALYGPTRLCHSNITLKDLQDIDSNVMDAMHAGFAQLLPVRDQAGRAIFFVAPGHRTTTDILVMFRYFVYLLLCASEDEETQKNGLVFVVYNLGPKQAVDKELVYHGESVLTSLPVRYVSFHYCYNDPILRPFVAFTQYFISSRYRPRLRFHEGTNMECQYKLISFGIPQVALPVTCDGELTTINHEQWLKRQVKNETISATEKNNYNKNNANKKPSNNSSSSSSVILIPGKFDVILGRGKSFQCHSGNLRLHHVIDMYTEQYETAEKSKKTQIATQIVTVIQKTGKFLKLDSHGWVEVSDAIAREKVSHTFRSHRSRNTTTNNNNNNKSNDISATSKRPLRRHGSFTNHDSESEKTNNHNKLQTNTPSSNNNVPFVINQGKRFKLVQAS